MKAEEIMKAAQGSKRTGFTLVELLVVIGIIAVLIGILLPSLARAREAAKVVQCGSQLRQVALAARAYAVENRDQLPPWPLDDGQPTYNVYDGTSAGSPAQPIQRSISWPYWRNGSSAANRDDLEKPTIGAGIGRLVIAKKLGSGEGFFRVQQCPAVYTGESSEDVDERTYVFNPHMARRTVGATSYSQPWWKKISKVGKVRGSYKARNVQAGADIADYSFAPRIWALATDPFIQPNDTSKLKWLSHLQKNQYAVNVAQADGSVVTAYIPRTITRTGAKWAQILDMLGYIEESAYGRGTGQAWQAGQRAIVPYDPD